MNPQVYSFLHVFSILLLTGSIFYIAANPQKHKKRRMMMLTGILSLVALVAAAGLLAKLYGNLPVGGWVQGWVLVKLVAWLFISALAGMAFRKSKNFVVVSLAIAAGVAVYMVYFRPF